ncbi:hypothetical protein H4R99_005385 [Coemansia sp. RSA 1722]|nr:hypothetical protein IWW45_006080 [Coemansia sp. RSA 485]KAJ2595363.1 hypothetical protein H4R99_005385 [Coemansia sp. RSA 1722]
MLHLQAVESADDSDSQSQHSSPMLDGVRDGDSAILAEVAMLSINPDIPHPDPRASSREKKLWNSLAKAYSEIREMQTKINRLLEMNLRYAEQLHQAIAVDAPRKRTKMSKSGTYQTPGGSGAGAGSSLLSVPAAETESRALSKTSVAEKQSQARLRAQTVSHAQPKTPSPLLAQSQVQPQQQQQQPQLQTQTQAQKPQQPVLGFQTQGQAQQSQQNQQNQQQSLNQQPLASPFVTQPFQMNTFSQQQQHQYPFQTLHAAQQQEQLQRRLNSALYIDHQNQQRFRSISSSSISLQQALAHARGIHALGPGFRNTGGSNRDGNNSSGGSSNSENNNALQMISQQVLQCTAAMPSVATAPVVTASHIASIHQQLMDPVASVSASTQAPSSLISLGQPLTPITGTSAPTTSHTAPSLSISASTPILPSAQETASQLGSWHPPRPGNSQPRLSVTVRPESAADIPPVLEEASSPAAQACDEDMNIDVSYGNATDLTESTGAATASLAHRRNASSAKRRLSLDTLVIGDPEQIPPIGRFDTLRQLFDYKERCKQHDAAHGTHWREKMDSKRRQNWSRISAVYNRIVQLRGAGTGEADVERAIREAVAEMESVKMTLTRYSQLVRKRLNNERRSSSANQLKASRARAGDQDQDRDRDQDLALNQN